MQTTITKRNRIVVLEPHNGTIAGIPCSIDISVDKIKHRNAAVIVDTYTGFAWTIREIKGLCARHTTIEHCDATTIAQCFNQIVEYIRNAS